jgi:hypothetical protein
LCLGYGFAHAACLTRVVLFAGGSVGFRDAGWRWHIRLWRFGAPHITVPVMETPAGASAAKISARTSIAKASSAARSPAAGTSSLAGPARATFPRRGTPSPFEILFPMRVLLGRENLLDIGAELLKLRFTLASEFLEDGLYGLASLAESRLHLFGLFVG